MPTVRAAQADLYRTLYESVGEYSTFSPGEKFAAVFAEMARTTMRGTVFDAGAGTGKGARALAGLGFTVTCGDQTDAGLVPEARAFPFHEVCLWSDLKRQVGFTDWVYCCDVMEHIPTPFAMLVVSRLLEVCRRGAFFSISLVPDRCGDFLGETLHHTVQLYQWWYDQLSELGDILEARDLINTGLYLLRPRSLV